MTGSDLEVLQVGRRPPLEFRCATFRPPVHVGPDTKMDDRPATGRATNLGDEDEGVAVVGSRLVEGQPVYVTLPEEPA